MHTWKKVNLISAKDQIGPYEAWRCEKCRVTGRQRAGQPIVRDGKYAASVYENCDEAKKTMRKTGTKKW